MSLIRVTPEELKGQGNNLLQLSMQTQEIMQQVDRQMAEINASWSGLAQEGYLEMYQEVKTQLDKMPELLERISQKTVHAAEMFGQVDEKLRSTFATTY